MVAANCVVQKCDVGWGGSIHDSLNFTRSELNQRYCRGVSDKYCLLGDCAYPPQPYMLVHFKGCKEGLSPLYYYWNFMQSSIRMPIERAFGMLKARFCIFLKRSRAVIGSVAVFLKCLSLVYSGLGLACLPSL